MHVFYTIMIKKKLENRFLRILLIVKMPGFTIYCE
jgi:hypothetical protein